MSWLFASGGQSTGALASVLPVNIQGWFPLGSTGLISLLSKGLSRVPKILLCVCMHAKSLQSCPALCNPMDCSPPGSSVHGILQARILEQVAIHLLLLGIFQTQEHWLLLKVKVKVAQSCLTLCNPMDHSLPGSSVQGILQARILEWVAISYSRGPFWPGIEPESLASPALAGGFFTTSATREGRIWVGLFLGSLFH